MKITIILKHPHLQKRVKDKKREREDALKKKLSLRTAEVIGSKYNKIIFSFN